MGRSSNNRKMIPWIIFSLIILYLILNLLCDPKKSKISVNGKTVVITGGTQGLGLAIANECLRRGANVALISRRAINVATHEGLEKATENNQVISLSADVTESAHLNHALDQAAEKFGEIDFLFTCAGLSRQEVVENLAEDRVRQQMNVNVLGTINAIRMVIPELKKRNSGRICIISSVAGQLGLWGMSAYCASKFALKGMAEAIQMEVIDTNVAVTIVYPPDMTTPGLVEENRTKPEIAQEIAKLADEVHPDKIVKGLVNAVESGEVDYTVGIDGWFAARCSVGLGPASSLVNVLSELILSNLFRVIALVYRKLILRIVRAGSKKSQ